MWVERTSFTASLTRRIRSPGILMKSLVARHDGSLDSHPLRKLPIEPALNPVGAGLHIGDGPTHERSRQRRALPQVVVIGLGDRGPEALVELRLHRLQLLPLPLEAPVLREMQVN